MAIPLTRMLSRCSWLVMPGLAPGIHVLKRSLTGRRGWPGHLVQRRASRFCPARTRRQLYAEAETYAASAALAFSAIAWNAAGSVMARSDSTLRSTVMPDLDRPLMKTL